MTAAAASSASTSSVTLGDLVGFGELGLSLVTGSPGALRRSVAGVHTVEIEEPTRWLQRSWLLLTVGTRLRGSRSAQRALVEELAEFGAAGLGFGTGIVFKRVPSALSEAAERADLPLIEVPLRTPFREVIAAFYRLGSGGDLRTVQRLLGMQHYLLDSLRQEPTCGRILARLSELVHAPVAIVATSGRVEIANGEAAWSRMLERLDGHHLATVRVDDGETVFLAVPISGGAEQSDLLLAVARPSDAADPDFLKLALRIAAPLLSSLRSIEDVMAGRQRAVDATIVDGLTGPDPFERRVAARHAEDLGFTGDKIVAAVVLTRRGRTKEEGGAGVADLSKALRASFDSARLPCLLSPREGTVRIVAEGDSRSVAAILDGAFSTAHPCGLQPADSLAGVSNAVVRAELAARVARERGLRRATLFSELDLISLLLGSVPPDLLQARLDDLDASFADEPILKETLLAAFANRFDTVRTAKALHLHPNSLRYRLGRIEAILGHPLKDPATIAELQFLLAGKRLRS